MNAALSRWCGTCWEVRNVEEVYQTCERCGLFELVDPVPKICFECWCIIDLEQHENNKEEEE
jgi:hypothetical protein